MNLWSSTLKSTIANLACDEALFHHVESSGESWLRLWTPVEPTVVLGYANVAAKEANLDYCEANGIGINRRISGGGTVVLLHGCLCYSLVFPIIANTPFEQVNTTNRFVMETNRNALEQLTHCNIKVEGVSDLAIDEKKFSGNAQKRGSRALLFHGSILVSADLDLISNCLHHPISEPDWRTHRKHADFITNLGVSLGDIEKALADAWGATPHYPPAIENEIEALQFQRYAQRSWQLCR